MGGEAAVDDSGGVMSTDEMQGSTVQSKAASNGSQREGTGERRTANGNTIESAFISD